MIGTDREIIALAVFLVVAVAVFALGVYGCGWSSIWSSIWSNFDALPCTARRDSRAAAVVAGKGAANYTRFASPITGWCSGSIFFNAFTALADSHTSNGAGRCIFPR